MKTTTNGSKVLWTLPVLAVVLAVSLNGLMTARAQPPDPKPAPKPLTGAELYVVHCNRCHAERYPKEWNANEWKTLMTHMRVRANLPAAQARAILKYLQEDSGS